MITAVTSAVLSAVSLAARVFPPPFSSVHRKIILNATAMSIIRLQAFGASVIMPSVVVLQVLAVVPLPPSVAGGAGPDDTTTAVHFDVMNAQGQRSIKGGVVVLNGHASASAAPGPSPIAGVGAVAPVGAGTGPGSGSGRGAGGASHGGRHGRAMIAMSLAHRYVAFWPVSHLGCF